MPYQWGSNVLAYNTEVFKDAPTSWSVAFEEQSLPEGQLVGRYWHDAMVQIDDYSNEGVAASSSWPFQVNLLKSQNKPIA